MSALTRELTNERIVTGAGACAYFRPGRPGVSGSAIGTARYCLGGRMSVIAAGGLAGTIAAAAA